MLHHLPTIVSQVLKDTAGQPDIAIQQALNKAFPYNKGNVDMWREYGKEIWKQSGRGMYGLDYSKVKK